MKYERKTLSPLNAQTEKKIVLYICCCDMLFVVVLTFHSARMFPKIYNLRSKGKWFLVRSPYFSLFPPACCCMSKLVLQSRAGMRWKDWQEDPALRERNCVSVGRVCNDLQGKDDKNMNTECSFRFRNVCWFHFIELQLIWVIWREGAIGGNAPMLCLNSLALGSLFVLLGSSFNVAAVFGCK